MGTVGNSLKLSIFQLFTVNMFTDDLRGTHREIFVSGFSYFLTSSKPLGLPSLIFSETITIDRDVETFVFEARPSQWWILVAVGPHENQAQEFIFQVSFEGGGQV